jgi:hypothetical protein
VTALRPPDAAKLIVATRKLAVEHRLETPCPGTRYAGVDLSHITAKGVSCTTARRVARGAHKKALGLTPPPSGLRTLTWDGWRVGGSSSTPLAGPLSPARAARRAA